MVVLCAVVVDGYNCSLLEVIDRNRSTINVTKLLQELETKGVVGSSNFTDVTSAASEVFRDLRWSLDT